MRLRPALMTCAALSGMIPAVLDAQTKPVPTQQTSAADIAAAKASVQRFIEKVDIPYESFTLPNGLRVLVHTDRSAPQVTVSVWYDVGSKHEPAGRSGFAHLFEHLMFNGSENVPGDYMKPLMAVGADVNGSTSADRTNYYETVPKAALERALFMESDRMGHLLGAITQASLDEQRGVVQNEKRQGDANPTSIIQHNSDAILFPNGHPYGHSVIGSMKDLQAADLDDVRQWFKAHYGPNNAVLILAGDVDVATARTLVTRYFGAIPAGPRNVRPAAEPVPLARTVSETLTAPITSPIVMRRWAVPGADNPDGLALDGVMEVMGKGQDSVLNRRLVREQQLFQDVSVNNDSSAQAGRFSIGGRVRNGVDPKVAAAALDREIARFLREMPSEDAVTRFIARFTYMSVHKLELVQLRASELGEHAMIQGDPAAYKANLRFYAKQTPASLMAVARRWLEKPHYAVTVLPGPRITPKEDAGMDGSVVTPDPVPPAVTPPPASKASDAAVVAVGDRGALPPVGPAGDAAFPAIEHARLRNGISIIYSRYPSAPFTSVFLRIKGGTLAEPAGEAGTAGLMYAMMNEGFAGHDEHWIGQRKERLGLSLSVGMGVENASATLDAPTTNLGAGLEMMREMLTAPEFRQATFDRLKREWLDSLASRRLDPNTLLNEVMTPRIDAGSPLNRLSMYDDPKQVRGITFSAVTSAFRKWVRPERAEMVVVSDQPLATLMPQLERTIGTWRAAGTAAPLPTITYTPQPGKPQVLLIDLPGSVQATVEGAQVIPMAETDPREAMNLANDVLASGFTSRVNMNLREDKHWTYGFSGNDVARKYGSRYVFSGAIQQDKVGPAIAEVMKEVSDIVGREPITEAEFDRVRTASIAKVASQFSNRYSVMGELADISEHGRPDDYPTRTSQRYRAVTLAEANAALKTQLGSNRWIWGIVGNAAIIRPQLEKLGLPVEVLKPADILPPM